MLESGCMSHKYEVNIMMKNVAVLCRVLDAGELVHEPQVRSEHHDEERGCVVGRFLDARERVREPR